MRRNHANVTRRRDGSYTSKKRCKFWHSIFKSGIAAPVKTRAVGAAALFAGAGVLLNGILFHWIHHHFVQLEEFTR